MLGMASVGVARIGALPLASAGEGSAVMGTPRIRWKGGGRRRELNVRFWEKIDKGGPVPAHRPELGPCWIWTGTTVGGYGQIWLESGMVKVHRLSFFLAEGRWPEPCALHHCDNPACVRRSHLFEGTTADNVADMMAKARHRSGNQRGEHNGYAKLSRDAVAQILTASRLGETQQSIADRFGISRSAISLITRRKTWSHVTALSGGES